ncbi:DNA-directed DNA polymerase gamma mip1 [Coemansia sp. RSA 455]|nr:DNA-directed DNA polymerase gamma mip1 [Coemansia sp. RSA 455]
MLSYQPVVRAVRRQASAGCVARYLILQRQSFSSAVATEAEAVPERKNELDIPMLAPKLRKSIFNRQEFPGATTDQIRLSIDHLKLQDIYGKEGEPVTMADFEPPPLEGATIEEHFQRIGNIAAEPYLSMAQEYAMRPKRQFPKLPPESVWQMRSGWTRYEADGTWRAVDVPDTEDRVLVFDVEVLVPDSPYPVLAAAMSDRAWYLWVSPYVTGDSPHGRHLIPLMRSGQRTPRLLIGHNIGFDRARIQEERLLKRGPLAFLDTMSLHVSGGGLCNQQRLYWQRYSRAKRENDTEYLQLNADTGKFFDVSSLNSLKEVAAHYCKINMDKSKRDVFMEGTLQDVRNDFAQLAAYCAMDVEITRKVYAKVFPEYRQKCPHPVSFAGMLTMLEGYLPVDRSWLEYIRRSEELLGELTENVGAKLRELAESALKEPAPLDDPWLKNLDWTVEQLKFTKPKFKADGKTYAKGGEPRPYSKQTMVGYPKWYRDLWDTKLGRPQITVRTRVAPYLLKLKWLGYPLYYSSLHGWTFRVPLGDYHQSLQQETSDVAVAKDRKKVLPSFKNMRVLEFPANVIDPDYERTPVEDRDGVYFKVPHSDGEAANCGNPLAKGYQTAIEDGTLSSTYAMAKEAMDMNAMCSYWISARERIKSQFVVWNSDAADAFTGQPLDLGLPPNELQMGVILPMVVPMGTVTRRAVESTWMTASNAKKNRLGSELKSMVKCPTGYRFVGADVDSEELWISALIGDSQFRMHGATAFGWMTLQGTKAAGTDLHSNTARILGISRGSAKVFNYGRIYGAGVKYAMSLLLQFNPDMTEAEAREKAERLYVSTKGTNMRNARLFGRAFWHGGTESYMFNQLEQIATADDPRTPALGCGITEALKKKVTGSRFMTSRVNWVVQSSGVDYLHLLLVSMTYLARRYSIDVRFVISVHDEIRYMVPECDVPRAELALQVANLWVRSLFSYRMGIEDLPQSVAFFSAVDIDTTLRKEVDMECVTPTNPTPIPPGVSHTILDTLAATNGGRLEPSEERLSAEFMLVDHSLYPASPTDSAPAPSLASQAVMGEPDYVWLTSQMLGEGRDISKLLSDAKRAAAVQPRSATSRARVSSKSSSGYSESKRVVLKGQTSTVVM